jgi:hypothetical protein
MLPWLGIACSFSPDPVPCGESCAVESEIDATSSTADAAPEVPPDSRSLGPILPDSATDAHPCPAAAAGCTGFRCASSSSCYYLCGAVTTWPEAQAACTTRGLGCLATIDSDAENACIDDNVMAVFPNLVWFGWRQLEDSSEPDGGWGWQCGSSSFRNWGPSEPNDDGGDENCGALAGARWIDGHCDTSLRYLCELRPVIP